MTLCYIPIGVLDRLRFLPIKKNGSKNLYQILCENEIKCADAFRMLTVAYGEATLDRSNVYRGYKMFSEGREDVNDEERAGRPSSSTTDEKINEMEKMILANRRITVREVAEDLNISIGSCHSIFINDLGMRRVAAKFVPKLLNCDQKQHRMNIANEMLDSVHDDPNLLQRVITGDEAWVYGNDMETKAQSSQWKLPHEPRPKKARQVRSNVKVLLTVFVDCRGVVHHEFLPQGRTVNKEYYLQGMRNLREAIRQKCLDLWENKNWLLHHDNAPAHTSLLVRDFLAKNNTLMMPQPPYSPDLAPCDFFLFPKLKRPMKGRRYATFDEIKTASKEELKKKKKKDFLKCFEDWKNRWHKCIISHEDYFEGDKIGARDSNELVLCRIALCLKTDFFSRVISVDNKTTRNERHCQGKLAAVILILDTSAQIILFCEYVTVDEKLDFRVMVKSEVKIRHKFNFIIQEIKDLESKNKAIVESKNIHRLKLFQQEVNERKISLNQVINTLLESELDDTQYDDYSKAKEDIFNMLVSIEEALSLIETKENTHSYKQLPESNVNLPKINLPIFNGDSANWLSFREIFNSTINSNQTLTEIQKFQYLNASVKGPAEKLIRGFPISDKNYQQAWDTLCNRFNNRRELAFSQINKIFSIRPLKSISTGSLYEILDVCNEGIRNLSVLGLEKNTLTDLILINFFEKRIGEALRKEWELTLQNEEYPTFENFVNFLEKHARSLQGMRIPLFQEQKTSSKNMMAHGLYVNKGQNCILCHQIHKLNDCQRFINLPLPKKWELVKKHKLCQNCLRANHEISKCLITSRCKNCKQNHHTLLHEYNSEPSIPQPTTSQEMLISTNTICNAMPLETETNILLSTALIKVKAKDGSFVLCRALVDNGSQISLISEQCCHKLGLEKRKNSYSLKGVGDIVVNRTTSQVEIEFTPHHNDQLFSARAFVVGRVTADLPNFQIQSADFPHLENLLLADPEFYVTKPIDLILGADTFVEIILGQKTDLKHHPIALNTKLGWLVSGRIHSTIKSNTSVINHCTTELDSSIRKFWELEDVPISKAQLGTKNACEILFKSNLKRDIEGRYSVNLPFKSTPNLGDSRSQALEKGLQENPSKSEDNSSKSEENLSRSEDNPSKSEEIPSKSKKSRISKLTPQITSKQNQLLPSESSQPSTPEQPLASQSSEPLSSKKETSIIPKIKPPPYYRRKCQLPAEKTSWDEPIESDIKSNWNKFQTQLSCLKEIKIPRYLNSSSSEIEELQLHGFCDASLNAYSAVFYLKTRFKIQKIKINLITSKTKVAPLKTITIPRLELSAALLLAQLNQVILESFPFQPDKTFLWTDSQICIDWIRSDASRWKAFVSNRVSSIQNLTQITDWFHVSSQDNPADCASRGIMPQDLVNHRIWWRGPIWLQENNVRYIPSSPTQVNLNIIQEEVGEGQVLDQTTLIQNSETMLNLEFIVRYSTMTQLIRITAWCWRFYYNCLLFDPIRQKGPLTTRELTKAIQVLVKSIQQVEFCTEIKLLKSNKQLPLSNKLTSLNPFLDTQGLLRVGGRLKYSYLNENQNFPLLQPKPPRQESLIQNLLTENADIPEAIDENQEDSSILETTFVIEDEESNKDIGTPKIEISEVSVIDKSEGKYSKEPVVSVEALDKKELCHDDPAHLNVVEADLNRPKEATSGIINVYTEANESSSKEKVVPVEIVDTSTKDYLQSGEKAKLSRWKPIDSLCLEDVKESEDDDENYSSSAYIEWPEILKKEVLRPEALEKAVNLEDFEKAAESRQLSKEHLEESTEQGSCIKAESKPWEDPIESDLAAAESDNPAVPERELANESENLIQDSPQSDTQRWKLIPLPFKQ
ncbi:hypothetical protein LAZ67_1006871 [Cordylochernes scorpioides]|uniref:Peptidase aspartic putative domain-containing protein n=1 Tax=Cordylochernes scorpioides TaxID=51811 RepID=A0ABY6K0P2_9ARAC|nr:hypothetical protein LAZ67_1006871 [Cordylochernes scorpioides]